MKFHFISSIFFAIFISLLAINEDSFYRMLLLIPCLILFYLTLIVFAYEYDKEKNRLWVKKENRLKEEIYLTMLNKKIKEKNNE